MDRDEGQEEEMKRKSNVKAGGRRPPDQDTNE
jgi:hypothetical protein